MISAAIWLPVLALAVNVSPPGGVGAPVAERTAPEPEPLVLSAELHGGYHTPLGAMGVALVLPFSRFTFGAGLGFGPIPSGDSFVTASSPLRLAVFGRFAVVDGQRFRLALAAGISSGGENDTAAAGDATIFWKRDGSRYDLGVSGELAAGPAWIGLEGGVGYLASAAICTQENANSVFGACDAQHNDSPPSNWVPYVGLKIRPRDRARGSATEALGDPAPTTKLRVLASGTAMDGADVFSDGHFDGDPDYSGGLEGDVLYASGPHLRVGVGLRYEAAHVPPMFGSANGFDHFLSVPFLIGAAIPLQRGNELELLAGIGVGAGLVRGGETADRSVFLRAIGLTTELSITYWTPVTRTVDLSIGAAVTAAVLDVQNGGGLDFGNSAVLRGTIPLRIGARWSL